MNPGNNPLARVLVINEESCSLHAVKNTLRYGDAGQIVAEGERSGDEIINRHAPDLIIINSLLVDVIRSELYSSLKTDPVLCSVPTIILSDTSEKIPNINPSVSEEKETDVVPAEKSGIIRPLPLRIDNILKMTGHEVQDRELYEEAQDVVAEQTEKAGSLHPKLLEGGMIQRGLSDNVSHDDYSAVFNVVTSPVLILDSEQHIRDLNHAALLDVHKAHVDLSNLPCYKVFHGPDATEPPENCPFVRAMKTKKTETAEMEIETLGRTYQISCTPVLNDAGEVMKVIHAGADITRIKDLEAEQAALLCQIKKNMVDMSTLNDGIRNPLTVILGRLEIDGCTNPDPIIKQIYRIDNLVTELDKRWVESLKIVEFVQKHYNISLPDSQNLIT